MEITKEYLDHIHYVRHKDMDMQTLAGAFMWDYTVEGPHYWAANHYWTGGELSAEALARWKEMDAAAVAFGFAPPTGGQADG